MNGVLFELVLIHTGCECYCIVNKNFDIELRLPRVTIPPKLIIGFVKENTNEPCLEIIKIIKLSVNI